MMKIVRGEYPPNFEEISEAVPQSNRQGVIFAYDNTIYVPTGGIITPHLMAHESVHGERQNKLGIKKWWSNYLHDMSFRYNEELLAHRAEYLSMIAETPNRATRRSALKFVAKRLASSLYGCGGGAKQAADDIFKAPVRIWGNE